MSECNDTYVVIGASDAILLEYKPIENLLVWLEDIWRTVFVATSNALYQNYGITFRLFAGAGFHARKQVYDCKRYCGKPSASRPVTVIGAYSSFPAHYAHGTVWSTATPANESTPSISKYSLSYDRNSTVYRKSQLR